MAIFVLSQPPIFRTDFNKRDAEGRLVALQADSAMYWLGQQIEGNRIRLVDAEGNSCDAVIDAVDGQILKVRPDWTTWTEEASVQVPEEVTFSDVTFARTREATFGSGQIRPYVAPTEYVVASIRTAARVSA